MSPPVTGGDTTRTATTRPRRALFRAATSPAIVTFLWTRAVVWFGVILAYFWLEPHKVAPARLSDTPYQHELGYGFDLWAHWDGGWFLKIAEHGYGADRGTAAFFPLYPSLVGALGRVLGGQYILAGILISLAATAVAFELLHKLATGRLGISGGNRAVLYLALFPMSLFLQAVYSESLYLLLALAAFLFAERQRWPWAAGAAGLALLTRPSAAAIYAGLAILAWRSNQRTRAFAWLGASLPFFLIYPLLLWRQVDDPWAFVHAEHFWGRKLYAAGPFEGLWLGTRAAWGAIQQFAVGANTPVKWSVPGIETMHAAAINLECWLFLVLYLVLTVLVWRRLGAAYGAFATVSLILPLATPPSGIPLLSLPRFGLVIFPFFIVLAELGHRQRRHDAIVGTSALLLGLAVAQWAVWEWVS